MGMESFYGFREQGKKSKYQSFALEIVAGCQLRCGNCYREPVNERGIMSSEFVIKMIHEAGKVGFAEIVLIGGEPTLHPDLPDFISATIRNGLTPILCTNGIRLAEEKYCEKVVLPGTTVVVHGLVPLPPKMMDQHVKMTGYTEQLQRAYRNLESLKSYGITIVSEVVVIKTFLPRLLEFHKNCRAKGFIPFIEINRRGNNGRPNDLSVTPAESYELFLHLQSWDRQYAPELADEILTPPAYGMKCTMSITGLHVKNFGRGDYCKVYSCCAQTVCHGDLSEKSLDEILADPSISVFKNQDEWVFGPCRKCHYYLVCRGGCRGEAVLTFGCSRASCPSCWYISPEIRRDHRQMVPGTCKDCPLDGNQGCKPKRNRGGEV